MSTKNISAVIAAKKMLEDGSATCVVIADGKILTTEKASGIKPILSLYDRRLLEGATVVDKVVGRAAALVMVAGGVRACYARVVSRGALEVFKNNGIFVEYTDSPEHIINRTGDGICPMEAATAGIDEPLAAICAIRARLEQLTGK